MAKFDSSVWLNRALIRYDRALARGVLKEQAEEDFYYERIDIDSLRVVAEWVEARALTVRFVKEGNGKYSPSDKEITVSARASPRTQLHVMLHECGHYLVGDNEKRERFSKGYVDDSPDNKKTLRHRLDVLEEEFEAWHRGKKLASRLQIPLDKVAYDKTRDKFLKSYVDWVALYRVRKIKVKKNENFSK